MNDLCTDIGYKSVNHVGEQLCGDHVEIVEVDDGSTIVVLSDGLGSGVKAPYISDKYKREEIGSFGHQIYHFLH